MQTKMQITYQPIGIINTPYTRTNGMPIQPSRAKDVRGTIDVFPEFAEGLADLSGFSHLILLCHMHRAGTCKLKVVPFLDTEERGVFATRAPSRPNCIGLSMVRLLEIEGNRLIVSDIDLLDGTPLLDIKPYVGDFDKVADARYGWLEVARHRDTRADNRFE